MMKILNWLMTAMFVFSVVVQYNDPDPARWMAIYGAAALACVLFIKAKAHWQLPAAIGLISLAWALSYASQVIGKVRFGELFEAFEMKDARVEVGREMGGLLIVAVWMAVLTVAALRNRNR